MQFMLLFTEPASEAAVHAHPIEGPKLMGAWRDYIGSMMQAGVMLNGDGLQPPATATTVKVRGGAREVQDGPYCEAKEYLGGYVTLEVDDLDAAIKWAEQSPAALSGSVEIRPVMMNETG